MADAAKQAEEGAAAIGRGEIAAAKTAAAGSRDQFRELAAQVKALLAQEQAERIAAAQRWRLTWPASNSSSPIAWRHKPRIPEWVIGRAKPKENQPPMPGMGRGKKLRAKGPTPPRAGWRGSRSGGKKPRRCSMCSARRPSLPIRRIKNRRTTPLRIVQSLDLKGVADRLAQLSSQVENRKLQDARMAAGDGAERVESAAEQTRGASPPGG